MQRPTVRTMGRTMGDVVQGLSAIMAGVPRLAPMTSPLPISTPAEASSPLTVTSRYRRGRDVFFSLLLLGSCLTVCYLALLPLLAGSDALHDPFYQAWHALFPWLPLWQWTALLQEQSWSRVGWLDPATAGGIANLVLILLALALLVVLLAARIGWTRRPLAAPIHRACVWLILILAAIFALALVFSPPHLDINARDFLLSWLAGRVMVVYHANPFVLAPLAYPHDLATTLLVSLPANAVDLAHAPVSMGGPLAVDTASLLSLLGRGQLATTLLTFRLLGLLLHLGNALLIWLIVYKRKPEMALLALVLYAWNPLCLLLGVVQVHLELMALFFVLLAIYCMLHETLVLGWFFFLLAVLMHLLFLLLIPLYAGMIVRNVRFMKIGERLLICFMIILLSLAVPVLACLPFWANGGWLGLVNALKAVFLPLQALNSLDALLLGFSLPASLLHFFNPLYCSVAALVLVGLFLFFALWLTNTIDWLLLCMAWVFLLLLVLQPLYWSWYILVPLALVLCTTHEKTLLLGVFLLLGALVSYYCWLRALNWPGQVLLTVALPCLLWGWCMFFAVTWRMTRAQEEAIESARQEAVLRPRPPWLSRPSWPSRPARFKREDEELM